jgi:hypothetical protein
MIEDNQGLDLKHLQEQGSLIRDRLRTLKVKDKQPAGLKINFKQVVGQGAFCKVFEASFIGTPCVVKQYTIKTGKPVLAMDRMLVEHHTAF